MKNKKIEGNEIEIKDLDVRVKEMKEILLEGAKLVEEKGAVEIAEEIRTGAGCVTVNSVIWNLPTKEDGLAEYVDGCLAIAKKATHAHNYGY